MFAQLGAKLAAVRTVVEKLYEDRSKALIALVATAITLGGCLPTTVPLVGPDPADPGAKDAGVRYRSSVAPYTSLRPTAPSSWRQQRDPAPAPKSGE
jgi:hypothetical protein